MPSFLGGINIPESQVPRSSTNNLKTYETNVGAAPSFGEWWALQPIDYQVSRRFNMNQAQNDYNAYVQQFDTTKKQEQTQQTGTAYETAIGALRPAQEADVAEYQRLAPLAQSRLLGSLNARGLGASVAAGGSGSGALGELSNQQQQGLFGIQSGYQDLANQLERQKAGDQIDLDAFFGNLGRQRSFAMQQRKSMQPDVFDVAKLGAGVLSLV